jgi:hypothetical protein
MDFQMPKTVTELLFYLLGGAMVVIMYFITNTLKNINSSLKELWEKHDSHEKRLSTLEGAHDAMMKKGAHHD